MSKKRAVVLAGEARTWEHSIGSAHELLDGADVYVSMWNTSSYWHKVKPNVKYEDEINVDKVSSILARYNVREITLEKHIQSYWNAKGYNANYIHRWRTGVDMVKHVARKGDQYDSVLFMRPDIFFEQRGMPTLVQEVTNVQPGQFVTMISSEERVKTHKTLNDFIFAVAPEDMDRAIPTVDMFQFFKGQDWHTFLCWWVVEKGKLQVVNIESPRIVLLRPPSRPEMHFREALENSERWDDLYVVHCINREGLRTAIKNWGKHAVIRAVHNFKEEG